MGGNIWTMSSSFDQANIPKIKKVVDTILADLHVKCIPIGSGATPKPGKFSGDFDVLVDLDKLSAVLNTEDPKEIRIRLEKYLQSKGFQTKRIAVTVHVLVPVDSQHVQVDIKVLKNAEAVARFHTHSLPDNSPYKGVHKQMMLNALATSQGLLWSPDEGLYNRDQQGKKAELLSTDPDQIAKRLIGTTATAKDLGSVESIMDAIPDPARKQEIFDLAKSSKSWQSASPQPATVTEWFRSIMDKI